MKDLKKEAIRNFVYKNFFEETPKKTNNIEQVKFSKAQENIVKRFLKKSIGPNKNNRTAILTDGGEFLVISRKGNIIGPS